MKATLKSCSCKQCKASKRTEGGKKLAHREERAFRHAQKAALRMGREEFLNPSGCRSRIG